MSKPRIGSTSRGGLPAVWAEENTRESIFDAMQRKEVYATTGPRMTERLFGGWDFTNDNINNRQPAFIGYAKGVPMGGDLMPKPEATAATKFMVYAVRDPLGANLDRIQIVKGWLNADGTTGEKVYEVAWSDDRELGSDGKLPPGRKYSGCRKRELDQHHRRSRVGHGLDRP